MRTLLKNKQTLYYCLYKEVSIGVDEYGNETLETEVVYESPVEFKANISTPSNTSKYTAFGTDISYSYVIVTCEDLPINEHSLIIYNHNVYKVNRVAKSLNSTQYAIERTNLNEEDYNN